MIKFLQAWIIAACIFTLLFCESAAEAAIFGGKGSKPIDDPGWPTGAEAVFNWPTRIAFWEGPPFGGGEWHAEAKGSADEVNRVLRAFAEIKADKKRVLLKSGIGYSFWLDPNGERRGDRDTKIDWELTVWVAERWKMQKNLPVGFSAVADSPDDQPVPVLTIYTASVPYQEIRLPEGLEVVDETLAAHGFTDADGRVIQGQIRDAETQQPLNALVRAQRITANPKGGYLYEDAESVRCADDGTWTLKNFPTAWSRLVAEAEGYAPRVIHHMRYDLQPGWEFVDADLVRSASLSGQTVDANGKPMAGARVRVLHLTGDGKSEYRLPREPEVVSDESGHWEIGSLPRGKGTVTVFKSGFNGPLLGKETAIPSTGVELQLALAAQLQVQVNFREGKVPQGYLVRIVPEGGEKVGAWSGSALVDDQGIVNFRNVPPGVYLLTGRPNPGGPQDETEALKIELKGGQSRDLELKAK